MASAGIPALVDTIVKKCKFKQLAMFSIQAVTKCVTPGARDWDDNMKEALECKVVPAVCMVLRTHLGHPGIMRDCMDCLIALLVEGRREVADIVPMAAEQIGAEGGVRSALESMNKDKSYMMAEVGDRFFMFLKMECAHNPKAVLEGGGGEFCLEVMKTADPWSLIDCFGTLAQLVEENGDGADTLAKEGCVENTLNILQRLHLNPVAGHEQALESGFSLLGKMCLNFAVHPTMEAHDGLDRVIEIVDERWQNPIMLKAAGQMLSKMSVKPSDGTDSTAGAWSEAKKDALEEAATQLAARAAERGKASQVVRGGGITALVACLDKQCSAKTTEAAAHGLSRLAIARKGEYCKQIIKAKAIIPVAEHLNDRFDTMDGAAAPFTKLLACLVSDDSIEKITKADALPAVTTLMKAHPEDLEFVHSAFDFLEAVAGVTVKNPEGEAGPYDMTHIVDLGGFKAVLTCMKQHSLDASIQTAGTRCLLYMCTNEENVEMFMEEAGLDTILANLKSFAESPEVHESALAFLSTMALIPANLELMNERNTLAALSITLRNCADSKGVRKAAVELLNELASSSVVQQLCAELQAMHTDDDFDTEVIVRISHSLGVLSVVDDNVSIILSAGSVGTLAKTLVVLAELPMSPELEEAMAACTYALTELSKYGVGWRSAEVAQTFEEAGAVKGLVAAMKGHPTMTSYVTQAAGVLRSLARMKAMAPLVVSGGAVEACVYAIRANADASDPETLASLGVACAGPILEIALYEELAPGIASRGGSKALLAFIEEHAGKDVFNKCIETFLSILEAVAMAPGGADLIGQQDGVRIMMVALNVFKKRHDSGSAIMVDGIKHVLLNLASAESVQKYLAETITTTAGFAAMLTDGSYDVVAVTAALDHLAAMAAINGLSGLEDSAIASLVELLGAAAGMAEGDDKNKIVAGAFTALGHLSSTMTAEQVGSVTPLLLQMVQSTDSATSQATIESLGLIAKTNQDAAAALVQAGGVETVVDILSANSSDVNTANGCYAALAAFTTVPGGSAKAMAADVVGRTVEFLNSTGTHEGSVDAVVGAVKVLAGLANDSNENAHAIDAAGGFDAVGNVVNHHCGDNDNPCPPLLGAAAALYGACATDEKLATKLVEGGSVASILETAADSDDYAANAECMSAAVNLLMNVAKVCSTQGDALLEAGAMQLILGAIARQPFDEGLLKTGPEALRALEAAAEACGSPAEELTKGVEALKTAFAAVEASPEDPGLMQDMKPELESVSAHLLIEGACDQASAESLVLFFESMLKHSLQVCASSGEMANFGKQILPEVVQAIGRLASLQGIHVNLATVAPLIVQSMSQQEDIIAESAMFCLGQMAENCDAASVKVLSDVGAVTKISQALQAHRTRATAELRQIALVSMEKVKRALQANAGMLVQEEGGSDAVYALLEATAYDAVQLTECIEAIFMEDMGGDALMELMSSHMDNFGVQAEVVKVLSQQGGREGVTVRIMNMQQLSGIVRTLQTASKLHHTQSGATKQQIAESASIAASSLAILSDATATESDSVMLVEGGGIEGIVGVIRESAKNEATLVECVRVLCQLAAHESERVTTKLAEGGVVQALLEATKVQPQSSDLAEFTIKLLMHMTRVVGVNECGITREGMQMVTRLIAAHQSNEFVQSEGPVLLSAIQQGLGGDAQTLAVKHALECIAAAQIWQAVWDEGSGAHYYFNNSTQGTQWDQPDEYTAMVAAVHSLETDIVYQNMDDAQIVNIVLQALAEHGASNVEIVKSCAVMLSRLLLDDTMLDQFCNTPGAIHAVVGIISANNYNPNEHADMIDPCVTLVEKLTNSDTFKSMAAAAGAIETINYCIRQNMHSSDLVKKATNVLVKLAYGSQTNMCKIVEAGCVETMQSVMQSHPEESSILETALCLLSNLMFENDENKTIICEGCAEEIIEIFRRSTDNASVLKMALRCVGNLSTEDANILIIVRCSATQCIADAMRALQSDLEFTQMAVEVIGNFASLEAEEDDEDGDEVNGVYEVINAEGGCAAIIEAMRNNISHAALLVAGMDALGNLCNDQDSAVQIIDARVVPLIIDVLQSFDFEEELLDRSVHLASMISYYDEGVESLCESNILPVLLLSLKDHAQYGDFMANSGEVIYHCCNHMEDADLGEQSREVVKANGGISTIFGLMEKGDDHEFLCSCVALATKLSVDDDLSLLIAAEGMYVLEKVVRDNFASDDFLVLVFTLIAQLAFIPENLLAIVQYHGIELIFDAIEKHLRSEELMVKCIETLDHISMADEEYATIIFEAKGLEYVEEIMKMYAGNEEVMQAGQSALVSMNAMQSLATVAKPGEEDTTNVAVEHTVDPLKDWRSMLNGGAVLQEWVKGTPQSRHVLIADDMMSIILKDTGKKTKKGLMMPLKSIKAIEKGLGKGHKKKMLGKKAKEELAFNIIGMHDEVISLCTNASGDCKRWVEALNSLLDVFKNHRKWLVKK
jgi:hypothetical protein